MSHRTPVKRHSRSTKKGRSEVRRHDRNARSPGYRSGLMATNSHTNRGKRPTGEGDIMSRREHAKSKYPRKPGYVVRGDKVYYRTKKGKEGSMPKGHTKMVARWGLKEVKK